MTNIRCGDETFIVQHADLKFVKKKTYATALFEAKILRKKTCNSRHLLIHNKSV